MEQAGLVNSNSERSGDGRMVDAMNRWLQRMGEDFERTGLYPMCMFVVALLGGLFCFGGVAYSWTLYPGYVGQPVIPWIVGLSFVLLSWILGLSFVLILTYLQ